LVLVLFPAFVYFYSIHIFTTNTPFSDDYVSHLQALLPIIQSDTLWEKLALIFTIDYEHRLGFNKVVFYLVYCVLGGIDLKLSIYIGSIGFLGFLFFIYKILPERKEKIFLLLPPALMIFQLKQNWVHMIWSSSIQFALALCFSGWAFYFLGKNTQKYFYSAVFFALFALFTQGSGVSTLLAGGVILIAQKRFKLAGVFFVGVLPLLAFYFKNFSLGDNTSHMVLSFSDIERVVNFFVSFLGSSASFEFENRMRLFSLGAVIIGYFVFLLRRKYYIINPTIFGFMVYVFIVAAMVALNRSGMGENAVFANRYKIYSLTMLVLVYISVIDLFYLKIKRKWIFIAGMIFITGFMYLVSFEGGKEKLKFAKYSQVYRINQWLDKNFSLYGHSEKQANAILTKFLTGGFYRIPYKLITIPENRYSALVNSEELCVRESEEPLESEFNVIVAGPESSPFLVRIEGMLYGSEPELPAESEPVYVVLRSQAGNYLFASHPHKRTYSSIHFRKGRSNIGLIVLIPIKRLLNNTYQIGVCYRGEVVYSNKLIIKQDHLIKVVR
jgi:hypothetical protein